MTASPSMSATPESRVWTVGALCGAIADALEARFNPVTVSGEISGFSRAASGHCYFSLKDERGQLRCAMFKRAASGLDFSPRDGELVELRGKVAVYEPRGDLQLIVDSMRRAGQGALFEQFLQLKARLEAEGLFDASLKRPLPRMPRCIGLVTSLGAAALHDVTTALQRRVPHIPVILIPSAVQGAGAPAELVRALSNLYLLTPTGRASQGDLTSEASPPVDVILLVRGGGSLEDLWAFNDEQLVRTVRASPVPLICGVGHETDFSLADFAADLRAPTPTAAAELVSLAQSQWLDGLTQWAERLQDGAMRHLDRHAQRLDNAAGRLGRPSGIVGRQQLALSRLAQRLHFGQKSQREAYRAQLQTRSKALPSTVRQLLQKQHNSLDSASLRLAMTNPQNVLQRGYAWLSDEFGRTVHSKEGLKAGQPVRATLADGEVDLTVSPRRLI